MNMPGSGSKASVMPACSAWWSRGSSACASRSIPASSVDRIGSAPGPERDAFGLEHLGQVDGAAKEVEADRAAGGVGVHQGRVVLHVRVEQIARTGLDDRAPSHGDRGPTEPQSSTRSTDPRTGRVGVKGDRCSIPGSANVRRRRRS